MLFQTEECNRIRLCFISLIRTGAHKPLAYRDTSVSLSLVVEPAFACSLPFFMCVGREMEQATGIEPALKAWEALILPLNYACAIYMSL